MLAREMGMLKLGKIAVDGSKIKANASRHSALSWGHLQKIEQQLQQEVQQLMERVRERDAQALAEYEAKMAKRQAKRAVGKKPGGKDPEPPATGPQDKDQINLTDEQSRIMKVGGGFDQCYDAQAAVATHSMLIVANFVTPAGVRHHQARDEIPPVSGARAAPSRP